MNANQGAPNRERTVSVLNGWLMLVLLAGALLADIALLVVPHGGRRRTARGWCWCAPWRFRSSLC